MKQRPVRKLLALVLSLLLVFAFTPAAFADGEVAQILETQVKYESLDAAFAAAKDGQTIQLLPEVGMVTMASRKDITETITLDLNGNTLSKASTIPDGSVIFNIKENGKLTINNGKIDTKGYVFQVVGDTTYAQNNPAVSPTLVIGESLDVTSTGFCVTVWGKGVVVDVYGSLTTTSTEGNTISGNGIVSQKDDTNYGGTVINIYDGASVTHTSADCAIYLPQKGECNVYGGTISGGMGIGIKSGVLNVEGGTIIATGEYVGNPSVNNNGISLTGSAISVDSNTAYAGGVEINIKGGEIKSEKGDAVREVGDGTNLVSITVSDEAVLSAPEGKLDISITNDKPEGESSKVSVTGGTFSKKIEDKYLVDDAISIKSGDNYYVGDAANKKIASATDGETIEVFKGTTITGVPEGVKVTNNTDKEITVNNEKVAAGDDITIESKTEPQPEPSNPSSSFTEPEYYPDYDEDVDYLPPVEDEEEEEKAPLYMVTCRTLNVRMGPGTSYAKLGTLSRGTLISGEYENGWVKFTYNGQTAYSSADYLMQVDGDLSGLHVTCRTLNVRAGAGTNFDILGTLSRGTEISVRDVLPGWYEIDFLGGIGYVSSAYIG